MKDIIFAISKVGASHLPLQKPCQDYSLSFQSEDSTLRMILVCDGHGSKTYVRSDVGARLAAEVAKEEVIDFCKTLPESLFKDRCGAVTTHPLTGDNLWEKEREENEMNESQKELYEQDKLFSEQVNGIEDIDKRMCLLFNSICSKWNEAIQKDADDNPFTEEEQTALGNSRLQKAYGSTLIAYVETKSYWFSFHIGDGRIVFADNDWNMTNPVPWDCRCFQNLTTSLCDSNPVVLFRYAFDGTGSFPKAVFCSSDGIEDSYGDYALAPERMHKFLSGLLSEFMNKDVDETLHNIEEFLPKLSENGSKDDMSLAGIIHSEKESGGNDLKQEEQKPTDAEQTKEEKPQKKGLWEKLSSIFK